MLCVTVCVHVCTLLCSNELNIDICFGRLVRPFFKCNVGPFEPHLHHILAYPILKLTSLVQYIYSIHKSRFTSSKSKIYVRSLRLVWTDAFVKQYTSWDSRCRLVCDGVFACNSIRSKSNLFHTSPDMGQPYTHLHTHSLMYALHILALFDTRTSHLITLVRLHPCKFVLVVCQTKRNE